MANVTDHRGNSIKVSATLAGLEIRSATLDQKPTGRVLRGPLGLALLIAFAVFAMILTTSIVPSASMLSGPGGYVMFAGTCLVLAAAWHALRRRGFFPTDPITPKLRAGRCPACNYTLDNLTPAPDLCTLCPECGAAWRLPPQPSPVNNSAQPTPEPPA